MGFLDRDRYDDLAKQLGAAVVRDRKRPALVKNGVLVEFEEHVSDTASTSAARIRFRAELPSPGVPKFRIYPEGFQSFMSKVFGGEDVLLDHRSLDLKFMVKARSPKHVQELWSAELCNRLDAMGEVWIEGEDQTIELEQRFYALDLVMDPVPGIELLFALGEVDLYGRDVIRALPEAQVRPEVGEVWFSGPSVVRMYFTRDGEDVFTRARVVADWAKLTDEVRQQAAQFGALLHLKFPGEIVVLFRFGERDPTPLVRGIELLRQLGSDVVPGDGVFR